ncbi:MAG TPA: DUF456 domain-containing protein [Salinivirgaceae bacterium]|nr:DUF456 domain-containing protein [Salinivirgaceae bacterium]
MIDFLVILLSTVLIILGFIGCFLPIIPGPPLAFLGIASLMLSSTFTVEPTLLWTLLGLTVLVTAIDYLLPVWLVKKSGVSKSAIRGATIGTILGLFFPPIGLIIGPFIGAFIGEILKTNNSTSALKGGLAAFWGFIVATGIKLALTGYMIWVFIKQLMGLL